MNSVQRSSLSGLMAALAISAGCESRSPIAPSTAAITHDYAAAAPARKDEGRHALVTLCHAAGNGRYVQVTVPLAAEPSHRAHGDAAPGEAVPSSNGMVFDQHCVPVAASTLITSGAWTVTLGGYPFFQFTMEGQDLVASGSWNAPSTIGFCTTCSPGQVISLDTMFDNPTPMTDISFARGTATLRATSYPFVEFGGPLRFEAGSITIPPTPTDGSDRVLITRPFTFAGQLKGYEVVSRRDPLLVFDVPLTGRGTVTLELAVVGPGAFVMGRLRYVFEE